MKLNLITQLVQLGMLTFSIISASATTKPALNVECGENGTIIVYGDIIRFSDMNKAIINCTGDMKLLTVFGSKGIFIDEDFSAFGKELKFVLISRKWDVFGRRKINLDGENRKGVEAFGGEKSEKGNGRDGKAGLPGGFGGAFLGFGEYFENGENLTITANGGNGGKGQDGENGMDGEDGQNATSFDTYRDGYYTMIIATETYWKHGGYPGKVGGNGGDGGIAGSPGGLGYINIMGLNPHRIRVETRMGKQGGAGKEGLGGSGGDPGNGMRCSSYFLFMIRANYKCIIVESDYDKAENGRNGEDGKSLLGFGLPKKGKSIDFGSKLKLKDYSVELFRNMNNASIKFFNDVLETKF